MKIYRSYILPGFRMTRNQMYTGHYIALITPVSVFVQRNQLRSCSGPLTHQPAFSDFPKLIK